MNYKYRVKELEGSLEALHDHGHFETLKEAQTYCLYHFKLNDKRNFYLSYKNDDGSICEQHYGSFCI